MGPRFFGTEQVTEEDRAYRGFALLGGMRRRIRQSVPESMGRCRRAGMAGLPSHALERIARRRCARGLPYFFRQAVARAVDSRADLRWGADRKGFRRLLHPNGICLTGLWEITEPTRYSGYFRKDSRALVIGRYSTCCNATRRGQERSLSLVGKLFPTTDPNHGEPLTTANFITQQDIGGDRTDYINDAELRNAPNTSGWRRGLGAPVLLVTGIVFGQVDKNPTIRQLYQIAELGKPEGEPTRTPAFMRLVVDPDQPRIPKATRWISATRSWLRSSTAATPRRSARSSFHIEVTDKGSTRGPNFFQRRTFRDWRRIGKMTFDNAVASYNGDFVIHFTHPTWRDDPNDPSTSTRVNEHKVSETARLKPAPRSGARSADQAKARLKAAQTWRWAFIASSTTGTMPRKPWIMPGYSRYSTGTPARRSASA